MTMTTRDHTVTAQERTTTLLSLVLGLSRREITDDLRYHSTPAWSSFAHVELMVALEKDLGVRVDADAVLELTSVPAIRAFIARYGGATRQASPAEPPLPADRTGIHRGLAGVVVDESAVCDIDGRSGRLSYRGYSIHDLAVHATFEEVAHLLLHGDLPTEEELVAFSARLVAARELPKLVVETIALHRASRPMLLLRAAICALGMADEAGEDPAPEIDVRERLVARIPAIFATQHALRHGRPTPVPGIEPGHARSILTMLDLPADAVRARVLDRCLVVHAEHGSNASAFTARVVTSTGSDLYAAVSAAIAAFEGPMHGGAAEQVATMVAEVGSPQRAADHVAQCRKLHLPVMGFGHRVYRTEDPRARHLRAAAQQLCDMTGDNRTLRILEEMRAAMLPERAHGLDVNVDFYSGTVYGQLGVPTDLFVPIFVAARMPGWLSHIDEQATNNVLIRPLLHYRGSDARHLPPQTVEA